MHVIATAGHVDHGKSTLVRLLTGTDPDRWAEEHRRGLTIDLGFAWTDLPSGRTVAFVDVPGHARFVPNMLAGVGPVPAVMLVVAADEGWMPQTEEHRDALAALGVRHGLIVVNRCDRAEPGPALAQARERLAGTGLAGAPAVAVSGATGAGVEELRSVLDGVAGALPAPDPGADVRLWVDRAFTVRGAGLVVTGTLPAGTIRVGDALLLEPQRRAVSVRGLHRLGRRVEEVAGAARVAVNLRGADVGETSRGCALVTSGAWCSGTVFDVRALRLADRMPREVQVHCGAATLPARLRPLGEDLVRITVPSPLPLHIGDRMILRDPGAHRILAGAVVLDVDPPPLRRRGSAAARAADLSTADGSADESGELRRRGLAHVDDLRALGVPVSGTPVAAGWLADPEHWRVLEERLRELVRRHHDADPVSAGLPVPAAARSLGLPAPSLADALASGKFVVHNGLITMDRARDDLPEAVGSALRELAADFATEPWAAPTADRLRELGLGRKELAAAVKRDRLLRIADGVYLAPGADQAALATLGELPQPFTLSQARQALRTSRRVAVPLLERLAGQGHTVRLADSRHRVARPERD